MQRMPIRGAINHIQVQGKQQQLKEGDKPKKVMAEARNRRALQDIGNLGKERAAKAKPVPISRPVTRSFKAQLVAISQAQKGAENKNLNTADLNGKVPVKEQVTEDVVVVDTSSNEAKLSNPSTIKGLKEEGSSRKKALTAVLSARSKAACDFADKLQDLSVDIDKEDAHNELAVVEYIDDLYKFYKETEGDGRVHDYIDSQPEINDKMRMILIDWLIEVHRKFDLNPETLYLTINIVDRYLSLKMIRRRELQLVGISAMLIASKYEEIWAPVVNDFVLISDNAYVREQVLVMEKAILERLEWCLTVPTPYVFLVRFIKASTPSDSEMENMVLFLAELGLTYYPTIVLYSSSMIAASAVYAARCTLDRSPFWTKTLKHHTGYSEEQLIDCAKMLVCFHLGASDSKLKAVQRKYSSLDRGTVALLPPAKRLL